MLLWGLVAIPATLWQRVHGAHHAHTNGDEDTDRRFLAHELTPVGLVAAALLLPNRVLRYSFTVFLYGILFPGATPRDACPGVETRFGHPQAGYWPTSCASASISWSSRRCRS